MDDSSNAASPLPTASATGATPAAGAAADAAARTVSLYEKTKKIYPKAVTGLFIRWRWILVWVTQIVFYGLPWLTWNDRQGRP